MARYQIILVYDGTDFLGSQRQANARTVQGELEKALRKIGWNGNSALMAGRTDTGVHAAGQVAAFDLAWRHSLPDLQNALNANLPADVAVSNVVVSLDNFHPRFDAAARRYRYRLFFQPDRNPLRERYAWRLWHTIDFEALKALERLWLGEHDFAAFGSPPLSGGSTVRVVYDAVWKQHAEEWWFEIEGNAFLYHMVRRLLFVQIAVAQGKISADDLAEALQTRSEIPVSGLAPAHGLTLLSVRY